jgi:hypothetical protein
MQGSNLTVLMALKGEAAWICLMCCNSDILFSVLVLHWVTSKDSSSASSSGGQSNSASRSAHASRSRNSIANKLSQLSYSNNEPTVTTHISAVRSSTRDDGFEDEIQRMDWGSNRVEKDGNGYPMGVITVQVDQVVEVERQGGNGRSSEASTMNGEELSRGRSHKSTEDLVERPGV